jgi:hypothetical protein
LRSLSSSSINEYTPVAPIYDPRKEGVKTKQIKWNYSDERKNR